MAALTCCAHWCGTPVVTGGPSARAEWQAVGASSSHLARVTHTSLPPVSHLSVAPTPPTSLQRDATSQVDCSKGRPSCFVVLYNNRKFSHITRRLGVRLFAPRAGPRIRTTGESPTESTCLHTGSPSCVGFGQFISSCAVGLLEHPHLDWKKSFPISLCQEEVFLVSFFLRGACRKKSTLVGKNPRLHNLASEFNDPYGTFVTCN